MTSDHLRLQSAFRGHGALHAQVRRPFLRRSAFSVWCSGFGVLNEFKILPLSAEL